MAPPVVFRLISSRFLLDLSIREPLDDHELHCSAHEAPELSFSKRGMKRKQTPQFVSSVAVIFHRSKNKKQKENSRQTEED